MSKSCRSLVAAAIAALALGCGAQDRARRTPLLPVPLVSQATSYSCGAAALMSVLLYFGVFDGPESELHGPLGVSPEQGTHPDRIVEVARRFGLAADKRTGLGTEDLGRALAAGAAVILDLQAWPERPDGRWEDRWEDGHYVVLVGMDESNVYAMDPSVRGAYGFIPRAELLRRWHDYELEGGRRITYRRMGIVVRGRPRAITFPGPPVRIE